MSLLFTFCCVSASSLHIQCTSLQSPTLSILLVLMDVFMGTVWKQFDNPLDLQLPAAKQSCIKSFSSFCHSYKIIRMTDRHSERAAAGEQGGAGSR